ncbi:hypothetical protein ACTA71_007050 [Dictyostelium dimigraforme]
MIIIRPRLSTPKTKYSIFQIASKGVNIRDSRNYFSGCDQSFDSIDTLVSTIPKVGFKLLLVKCIAVNHTKIQVNNFNRFNLGSMSIGITTHGVSIENNYIYCFPAIITSISSVPNHLGVIINFKFNINSNNYNCNDQQCKFIKLTTMECQLNPNESGDKNLPINVNFNGCNSTSSGITFTYGIPTLSSGLFSNGIVTLIGTNNESFVQLLVSPDEIPSVSNGTLIIELYYIDCTIRSSTPSITFDN